MPSADIARRPAPTGRTLVRTVLAVLAYCAMTLVMYAPDVLRF
ncbi:hypothetical protein [Denitromonas sp.]|nr:hypothetical protein [Denitromonas sp.]